MTPKQEIQEEEEEHLAGNEKVKEKEECQFDREEEVEEERNNANNMCPQNENETKKIGLRFSHRCALLIMRLFAYIFSMKSLISVSWFTLHIIWKMNSI